MHTDEFEIALSRELTVCKNTIQRIKKTLAILERKHHKTTALFMEELQGGISTGLPEFKDDYDAWQSSYASLKRWEKLEEQYQEAYKKMKI